MGKGELGGLENLDGFHWPPSMNRFKDREKPVASFSFVFLPPTFGKTIDAVDFNDQKFQSKQIFNHCNQDP